jgi:hypothetical protein
LTLLATQHVATMRSTVEPGFGKSRANFLDISVFLRISTVIDTGVKWQFQLLFHPTDPLIRFNDTHGRTFVDVQQVLLRARSHALRAPSTIRENLDGSYALIFRQ